MTRRHRFVYLLITVVILLGIILFLIFPSWRAVFESLFQLKTIAEVRDYVQSLGFWGPILSILLMILHSVTFIPSEVILFADLVLFGPVWGVVYAWVGSMLGAYLSFFLARMLGRPAVERFVSSRMVDRFDRLVQRYGVKGLLVLRLIPFVSFNALNYSAGLTNLSLWKFLWTTGVGILPLNILFAFVYQSATGQKYALIGLTVAGVALLAGLVLKEKLAKKYNINENDKDDA